MKISSHFYPSSPGKVKIDSAPGIVPARVIDIIMDESHTSFKDHGDIGAIRFRILGKSAKESRVSQLGLAYPINRNFFQLPLLEEIVYLHLGPKAAHSGISNASTSNTKKVYYSTVLAVWNHPHWNPHPDSNVKKYPSADPAEGFIDSAVKAPLLPFTGDTLIEGRFGNSIRFTGASTRTSPYQFEKINEDGEIISNNGQALTIIRNGQKETGDGYTSVLEDVNEDASSIYLAENHIIPLSGSSPVGFTFIDSNQEDSRTRLVEPPADYDTYIGGQVVINSDRIVFNSKEDSILLSSAEAIGLSGKQINIDAIDIKEELIDTNKSQNDGVVVINGGKIYLGLNALRLRNAEGGSSQAKMNEPAVLGRTNMGLMRDLIHALYRFAAQAATPNLPSTYIPALVLSARSILGELERLDVDLETTLSKKVFLEPELEGRRQTIG